jgi:hypothetical protein
MARCDRTCYSQWMIEFWYPAPLINLRKLTFSFDEYVEECCDRKRWKEPQEMEYNQLRSEG